MNLRYGQLMRNPQLFQTLTGLRVDEFDALVADVAPRHARAEQRRHQRPQRKRAIGAGHPFELAFSDQLLLTVFWLRHYPIYLVLGLLFQVSESSARRTVLRLLPLLEPRGRAGMRMPLPHRGPGRSFETLLSDLPALRVVVDSFEQRVQRPTERAQADRYYSGKKKQHTLKSQVAVN